MSKKINLVIFCLIFTLILFTFHSPLAAESYPNKTITLIGWSTPGGGSDTTLRMLAPLLEKHIGQKTVVINKPGGAGGVALKYLKGLPADGHNVLLITASFCERLNMGQLKVKPEDFDYLIRLVEDPFIIAVNAKSPYKTYKDILDAAKKKPGMVKWAGSFYGSKSHIAAFLAIKSADVVASIVPFDGSAQAVVALLGGHIDVLVANPGRVIGHIKAGKVRPIAVLSAGRLKEFPDLPTLKELGFDVIKNHWRGLIVKKGTPPHIIKILHDNVKKTIEEPKWIKFLKDLALSDGYLNGEDFYKLTKRQVQEAGAVLDAVGFHGK